MVLLFCAENVRENRQRFVIKIGIYAIVSELLIGIMIFLSDKIEIDKFSTKTVNTGTRIFDIVLLVWLTYLTFEFKDRVIEENAKTNDKK